MNLNTYETAFKNATPMPEYIPVPDGEYLATLDEVEFTESKENGRPMLKWTFTIQGPKYKNRKLWKYSLLDTWNSLRWLKRDLGLLKMEVTSLEEVVPALQETWVGKGMKVYKKTVEGFDRVYLS